MENMKADGEKIHSAGTGPESEAAAQTGANDVVFNPADKLLAAGAFVLGLLFVWLFYSKYPGISIPIFVVSFYVLLLVYSGPVLTKEARFGWFLSIPVLMISFTYFLFGNEILMILDMLALPPLIMLQTLLITGSNSYSWHSPAILIDLIFGIFVRCLIHVVKPFKLLSRLLRKKTAGDGTRSVGLRILTGLLISLPLLIVLLALLASADMVFGKLVERLPDFFDASDIENLIGRAFTALTIFFLSFSYVWSVGHRERPADSTLNGIERKTGGQKRKLDQITIITVTILINILYIVFAAIQFTYLFGGSGLPDGFTYAEYARRGFFELILVSLLNIGLLAVTLTYTGKGTKGSDLAFRLLNSILIGCTFIMLYSAHFRMSLYEKAYGFTFLRIMTQAFMIFLLVLFVITLARVWIDRLPLLKPYIAAAISAFAIINYINVDDMIARNNIKRYYSTNVIDMNYFRSLSSDVTDELIRLAKDGNVDVAAAANEMLKQRKDRLSEKGREWQSFNLSDYRALKELEKGW